MLINAHPERFSLLYDPNPCADGDAVLLFHHTSVLLKEESDHFRFSSFAEVRELYPALEPLHAFTQDRRRIFIGQEEPPAELPLGWSVQPVRVFRLLTHTEDGFLLNAAYHLSVWYATHRYCGVCGGEMHPAPVERALTCSHCGFTLYPSIAPAVIVAITNGDRLLLALNANRTFPHYSLIAGYVEIGETAEQTVQREVMEEVGLKVKNIRYIANQPWGFSQTMMLAFQAELDGSPEITLQESELSEAAWFARSEIPINDSSASIAFDLMERFRNGNL